MKLRILADKLAMAAIDTDKLQREIATALRFGEVESYDVGDRYGVWQVNGIINPRGAIAQYEDRTEKGLARLILTGYELRTPNEGTLPSMSRATVATVVSTQRMQGSVTQIATASVHGLFHQLFRISSSAPQHDPSNPGHCKNRCIMRPVEDLGALRHVANDWRRGRRFCPQCQSVVRAG